MAQAPPVDSGVWVEIEYLEKHEAHLRSDWFRYRGHPLGSGAVERAIRRVVNLRLKGNGIYGREENAEGMLVLRSAALTGRWQETMERAHAAMAVDRRRAWDWEAPDIVVELNSGVTMTLSQNQPPHLVVLGQFSSGRVQLRGDHPDQPRRSESSCPRSPTASQAPSLSSAADTAT
jgi:hypothetical protein